LNYNLNEPGQVLISIFDNTGKQIELVNEIQLAGQHQTNISPAALNLSAGLYFISIQTEKEKLVIPVIHNK
jgi:hypothetical protein